MKILSPSRRLPLVLRSIWGPLKIVANVECDMQVPTDLQVLTHLSPRQVTQSNIILLEKCKCERWKTCLFDYFLVTLESGVHSNTAITTWRKKALKTRREDEQEVSLNTRDKTKIPSEIWPAESLGHKREEKLVKKANQRLTWLLTKLLRGVKNGSFTKQEC